MQRTIYLSFLALSSCAYTLEPGHRGLLFDPWNGGLHPEILEPGRHHTGVYGRIDDFDITYSTRTEEIQTTSSEGLALGLHMAVIYRPVAADLFALDTEIGPNYYEEVIGPEFRSTVRGVFARHSYMELLQKNESIENEIEDALRRRIAGKHIEISSVTLEGLTYAPEIGQAIQQKLVGEQEAARQKTLLENEALRRKQELGYEAEQAKLKADAALLQISNDAAQLTSKAAAALAVKESERKLAEEQAKLDAVRARSTAEVQLTEARSEAERRTLVAHAKAAENAAITPLSVQYHAYDALQALGGTGTSVLLGDWSHVPNFLLPPWALSPYGQAAKGSESHPK